MLLIGAQGAVSGKGNRDGDLHRDMGLGCGRFRDDGCWLGDGGGGCCGGRLCSGRCCGGGRITAALKQEEQ